jgi:hypothetical protein
MDTFETLMDDIPLLQDLATETDRKPFDESRTHNSKNFSKQITEPSVKENPFLPYEHLARLAQERQQFKQELDAFTENMKRENLYKRTQSIHINEKPLTAKEATIKAITEKVLTQLKPIIEEQINKELSLYLDECTDS